MEIEIGVAGALIAIIGAFVAAWQAWNARVAVKQAELMRLFSTFDIANQATLEKPELLYTVHGLNRSVPEDEAANIAYLSFILDGFQHYYELKTRGDFKKMVRQLKQKSTFLNKILAVSENQKRWQQLKTLYYGDFDNGFIQAIEDLIDHENTKRTP